jgi:hypothetical protein
VGLTIVAFEIETAVNEQTLGVEGFVVVGNVALQDFARFGIVFTTQKI